MNQKVKVLIVDDSSLVRKILREGLEKDPMIEVVGVAPDPYAARDMIVKLRPNVLTLDVEMPKMDGIDFLRKLMPQYPIPVIMVSSLTQRGKQLTFDALDAGAIDFVPKPTSDIVDGLNNLILDLREKVKAASKANVEHWRGKKVSITPKRLVSSKALDETTFKVIAIGASTGGTEALRRVIEDLPATTPGIVVVQHMPSGFTKMYAERLNQTSALEVIEGKSGDRVIPGRAIIAPGGKQMKVKRVGGEYIIECAEGEKVNGHSPSVSVLFKSVSEHVGKNAVGVMLTGMGGDGAAEMLEMKNNGSYNIAQDEKTSVVFGMPKVAIEKGAVHKVLPITDIAESIINHLRG